MLLPWQKTPIDDDCVERLYQEVGESKYLSELEEYADKRLTIQERLGIYLGISGVYGQCIDSADVNRCEVLFNGIKRDVRNHAEYLCELHAWMMDNERLEFAYYLAGEGY